MRSLLPLAILTAGLGSCSTTSLAGVAAGGDAPLVLELFTSQGCSSCPPAEALANRFVKTGNAGGRAVVPLQFHVDYWDDLGWPDPFASAAWTERQREYAAQLKDRVYTPELVVGGRATMVGSSTVRVMDAIAAAPAQRAIAARATWDAQRLRIEATAPDDADVFVAIWQDGTRVRVPRGENAGATLSSDHVVRRFLRVARAGHTESHAVALDPSWGSALGAVAFAQKTDRTIVGAALLPRGR